jgi:hypothetical protein
MKLGEKLLFIGFLEIAGFYSALNYAGNDMRYHRPKTPISKASDTYVRNETSIRSVAMPGAKIYSLPSISSRVKCIPEKWDKIIAVEEPTSHFLKVTKGCGSGPGYIPKGYTIGEMGPDEHFLYPHEFDENLNVIWQNAYGPGGYMKMSGEKRKEEISLLRKSIGMAASYKDMRALDLIESIFTYHVAALRPECKSDECVDMKLTGDLACSIGKFRELKSIEALKKGVRVYDGPTGIANTCLSAMRDIVEEHGKDYNGIAYDCALGILRNVYDEYDKKTAAEILSALGYKGIY